MALFTLKPSGGPRDLEISMAGLKLGSTVLQVGGDDPGLIAALAKVIGLSGRASAVARSEDGRAAFARAAEKAGVLVEVAPASRGALPFDDDTFDLAILKNTLGPLYPNDRVQTLQQTLRVLRIGGRCLVIDRAMRGGLGAIFSRQATDPRYLDGGGAQAALKAEGFRGVRRLADRYGLVFVEGTKARLQPADEEGRTEPAE